MVSMWQILRISENLPAKGNIDSLLTTQTLYELLPISQLKVGTRRIQTNNPPLKPS